MKKYIMILAVALGFGMNLSAQKTDGFFTSRYTEYREPSDEFGTLPILPNQHGFEYDVYADAPLGSGIIFLAAMGAAYGIRKRKNKE